MICPNCNDPIKPEMNEFRICNPYSPTEVYLQEVERVVERPEFTQFKLGGTIIESIFICPKCGTMRANLNGM